MKIIPLIIGLVWLGSQFLYLQSGMKWTWGPLTLIPIGLILWGLFGEKD